MKFCENVKYKATNSCLTCDIKRSNIKLKKCNYLQQEAYNWIVHGHNRSISKERRLFAFRVHSVQHATCGRSKFQRHNMQLSERIRPIS